MQIVLDNMNEAVQLFDKNFDIEFVNQKLYDFHRYGSDIGGPGVSGYEGIRHMAKRGDYGVATRGIYRVKLHASGRAAHSSLPHLGESAIDKLIDALVAARGIDWPVDADLGRTHYTVGLIKGGVAPNVIPPAADAEMMFRTVGSPDDLRRLLQTHVGSLVTLDDILIVPPVRLKTLPDFDTAVFSYFSDIPFLDKWGTPLLLGPGSIHVAHTDHEHIAIDELNRAVETYEKLAATLLSS